MRTLAAALALALGFLPMGTGCVPSAKEGEDRWATTANTNVKIDWDKVNEAYKVAEGPEDLERRINEIYEGDEIISISVQDLDTKVQEVTGFFDKNTSGTIDEGEQIFTIKREITGEGAAQYQTHGYGAYAGYHSPMLSIMTGMMLGSMMSRAFMPGYTPSQPYRTSSARSAQLRSGRGSYRAANPGKFSKPSGSGKSYNSRGSAPRGGGGRGGGGARMGIKRGARRVAPIRLTA